MGSKRRILVVDDEELWVDLLKTWLQTVGYSVQAASSGAQAVRTAEEQPPDCVVLDYMLPDKTGAEVCRMLRASPACRTVPIVLMTAHTKDKVLGLQSGADYFVQKSEKGDELVAILQALFRRRLMDAGIVAIGDISLNPKERAVHCNDEFLANLSPKTFDLLYILVQSAPAPVSKEDLFRRLEGKDEIGVSRALDLLLNRLRKAIGGRIADRIKSVKGYGYVYIPPKDAVPA